MDLITECEQLQELNITGTKISEEGKARIIMGLPRLIMIMMLRIIIGWPG